MSVMSAGQLRAHAFGRAMFARWPGAAVEVDYEARLEDACKRVVVRVDGKVVAESGWCESTDAALDVVERAIATGATA